MCKVLCWESIAWNANIFCLYNNFFSPMLCVCFLQGVQNSFSGCNLDSFCTPQRGWLWVTVFYKHIPVLEILDPWNRAIISDHKIIAAMSKWLMKLYQNGISMDWIGLDLFNDDTRPSGHISRPTQVNVSELLSFSKQLLKSNNIVQSGG